MFRFLVELGLFALILTQIVSLTAHTREPAPQTVTMASLENAMQDPYGAAPHISNEEILQKLAQQEAQRMIETGDVTEYRQQLEDNRVWMRMMGYNF